MLSVRMTRLSAYALVLHVAVDVLRWYPMLSFSSHLRSGYKKMIKRYGFRMSAWMIPLLI